MSNNFELKEVLNYGLRALLSYQINAVGWSLSHHLGWHIRGVSQLFIHEVSDSEVNTVIEIDPVNQIQWIAVRGSSNLRNWMLNLQYVQHSCGKELPGIPCGGVDFHRGFRQAAAEVYRLAQPYLRQGYKTRLTGHSLGGAIAAILMVFLQESGYTVEHCITFGQPKITDRLGAQKLTTAPLLRFIHDDDIVPTLPPSTVLTSLQGGYEHFGEEILLGDSLQAVHSLRPLMPSQQPRGFWRNLLHSIAVKDISELSETFVDHSLHDYLYSILNHLEALGHLSEYELAIRAVLGQPGNSPEAAKRAAVSPPFTLLNLSAKAS